MYPKVSNGFAVAFPDVCKVPGSALPSPIPIPYPTIAKTAIAEQQATKQVATKTTAGTRSSTNPQLEIQQLKASLGNLHMKLLNMTSTDPADWQREIEGYVVAASAIFMTMTAYTGGKLPSVLDRS